jgi:hypothetical protein
LEFRSGHEQPTHWQGEGRIESSTPDFFGFSIHDTHGADHGGLFNYKTDTISYSFADGIFEYERTINWSSGASWTYRASWRLTD